MGSQKNQQHTLVEGQQYPLVPRREIDVREWWLWTLAVVVTLVLLAGIVALTIPGLDLGASTDWFDLKQAVRGLAGLVLIFDIYTLYQHLQLQRIRRALAERDQLFQLITENAADMIGVVDTEGRRLYNSPAYQRVLGYTTEELKTSSHWRWIPTRARNRLCGGYGIRDVRHGRCCALFVQLLVRAVDRQDESGPAMKS